MSERVVLLVDPSPGRRGRIQNFLTAHYEVIACDSPEGAFEAARSRNPDLGLVSLGQTEGNGLELAQKLRQNGMKEKLLAVYGKPRGKTINDRTRRKLERAWKVDRLVLKIEHPSDLESVVGELLQAREKKRHDSSNDIRALVKDEASAASRMTFVSAQNLDLAEEPESWKDLLTGEITAANLKKLLGRKLF